jgi:uncharacterized membrane protein YeaQ/YmgE (transglycosylase-associated protein family)
MNIALWILAGAIVGWLAYAVAGYNAERGLRASIIIRYIRWLHRRHGARANAL